MDGTNSTKLGNHELRLHAQQVEADLGIALEVERHRSLDDRGAKAAPRRRLHRRTAALLPFDDEAGGWVKTPDHFDTAGGIGKCAVFGGIGHHLMHDERQRGERLWIERDVRTAHLHPFRARTKIGAGLGLDQGAERDRGPVQVCDLVVGARQLDAAAEHAGELLDAGRGVLALRHQGAHEAQDVADAVIELGDH